MRSIALSSTFVVALVALSTTACSPKNDHPANLGSCGADANCTGGGPITGGGGGGDGGTTGDTATSDAGQVAIGTGHVAVVNTYSQSPSTGTLVGSTTMTVRGLRGGTFSSAPVVAGGFTLGGLDDTAPINWLYLDESLGTTSTTHTIYGFVVAAAGGSYDVDIPVFADSLPTATAATVGYLPETGTLSGTATVVVQVLDASGVPVKGVTADLVPGRFYDDGSDGFLAAGTSTGARGTILWLGVGPTSGFDIVFTNGAARITIVPHLKADAVTFVQWHP